MSNINIRIGTEELAQHLDQVTSNVVTVGTAISAMQGAVVKAECDAAQKISNHVTYGFYMLVRNQFTQKMVTFENQIMSDALVIDSYMKQLAEIRGRMEKDYNLISRQYLKTFERLNQNLKSSIKDIDSALMEISIDATNEIFNRVLINASRVVSFASDILPSSQFLVVGSLKEKISNIIHQLDASIEEGKHLQKQFLKYLGPFSENSETNVYFPVILMESESLNDKDNYLMSVNMPQFPSEIKKKGSFIHTTVLDSSYDSTAWKATSEKHRQLVRQEFLAMLSDVDTRSASEMIRLFDASHWQEMAQEEADGKV